jgi:hypothetical protein
MICVKPDTGNRARCSAGDLIPERPEIAQEALLGIVAENRQVRPRLAGKRRISMSVVFRLADRIFVIGIMATPENMMIA